MEKWKLKSVRLLDMQGVTATYQQKAVTENSNGSTLDFWKDITEKSTINRHPDLDRAVDKLTIHVARIFSMMGVGMIKPEKDFTTTEKRVFEKIQEQIEVTGITLSDSEDAEKCQVLITANMPVLKGKKKIVLNTPLFHYKNDMEYEFAHEVAAIVDEIKEEVYEYLFKRKYGQLEMFPIEEMEGMTAKDAKEDAPVDSATKEEMMEKNAAKNGKGVKPTVAKAVAKKKTPRKVAVKEEA